MSRPNEQDLNAEMASRKLSRSWKLALSVAAALLGMGILLRLAHLPVPAWILVALGAMLAFILILPALGGRMQEPGNSPFRKAPWGA